MYKIIDLFCGAGGISEGILQAGFHIAFSNEINKEVSETYRKRHEQLGIIQGKNTWLEVSDIKNISGKYILEKIKWKGKIERAKADDFKSPAERPKYSKLSSEKVENLLGEKIPNWENGLDRFLKEMEFDID